LISEFNLKVSKQFRFAGTFTVFSEVAAFGLRGFSLHPLVAALLMYLQWEP